MVNHENEKEFEALFREAAEVRLTPDERASLRRSLLAYMAEHPVRERRFERQTWQRSSLWSSLTFARPMPIALAGLLIIFSGGVSLAAEGALPGDVLYAVKVNVNEELRARAAFSPEAKVAWEIRRAERRLEEAETLASRGELKAEARSQVEEHFGAQTERVRERIAEFESRGDVNSTAELSSNFEASLRAHEQILHRLGEVMGKAQGDVDMLRLKVKKTKDNAAAVRSEAEAKIATEVDAKARVAAEGRMSAAQEKVREVRSFLERTSSRHSTEAEAEARIAVAEQTIADGKAKLDAGEAAEAFRLFQKSHRIAQEAKLLIAARRSLSVELNLYSGTTTGQLEFEIESTEEEEQEGETSIRTSARTTIATRLGEITLTSADGEVRLAGVLGRSTPCVDWQVEIATSGSSHASPTIEFRIRDRNRGVICAQILGQSQEIRAVANVSANTEIRVRLEEEIIFEGRFDSRGEEERDQGSVHQELELKAKGTSRATVEIENSVSRIGDVRSKLRSMLFGE